MKQVKALRHEIIQKLWSYTTINPRSSPEFHKWLEDLLSDHSNEIVNECLEAMSRCDLWNDAEIEVKKVKQKFK